MDTLLKTMKRYQLPNAIINRVYHFISDRRASMLVDGVRGKNGKMKFKRRKMKFKRFRTLDYARF